MRQPGFILFEYLCINLGTAIILSLLLQAYQHYQIFLEKNILAIHHIQARHGCHAFFKQEIQAFRKACRQTKLDTEMFKLLWHKNYYLKPLSTWQHSDSQAKPKWTAAHYLVLTQQHFKLLSADEMPALKSDFDYLALIKRTHYFKQGQILFGDKPQVLADHFSDFKLEWNKNTRIFLRLDEKKWYQTLCQV